MRAFFTIICMALVLSLPITSIAFVQDAYAQDGDGGDGDGGDSGPTDFGPRPKPIILDKKHYTTGDMKRVLKQWKDSNEQAEIYLRGGGRGIEFDIIGMIQRSPAFTAKLLNKLSRIKFANVRGALRAIQETRKEIEKALKLAKKIGTDKYISDLTWIDGELEFKERWIKSLIKQGKKKTK